MNAQKKQSLVTDQDAPRVQRPSKIAKKRNPQREGDDAKASSSTVQSPIQRPDDDPKVVRPFDGERPVLREPDPPPPPTQDNTVSPIQRPDPDPIDPQQPGCEPGTER
jgi:hypothetical protein